MWINLIGAILMLIGLVTTLDSRRLVKKYFNFGEENTAVTGLKIVGFIITFIGGIILMANT